MKMIIATLVENVGNKLKPAGFKIIDTETKEFKLLKEDTIIKTKLYEKLAFVELKNGCLVSTQGSFDRYTKISVETAYPVGETSPVILGKTEEGYYLVVENPDYPNSMIGQCKISYMSFYELKSFIILHTRANLDFKIANARIENQTLLHKMIIRPIKGEFPILEKKYPYIEKDFSFKVTGRVCDKWKVRIVKPNERYGREYCLVNDSGKTIVEFYDLTQDKEKFPMGQFVASYYLQTLLEDKWSGLYLNASIPFWYISEEHFKPIYEWLEKEKNNKGPLKPQ